MFGLMQLAAELDNPFRDSGFGFDKVDVFCCFLGDGCCVGGARHVGTNQSSKCVVRTD